MNIPDGLLPNDWLYLAHALYALVVLAALWRAPWRRLARPGQLNAFLGATVAVMVVWTLKAGVMPGLNFHILGTSLLTLMFGWLLAVVAISATLLAATLSGMSGWQTFSLNALLMGALPAAVTWGIFRLVERLLPRNLFIYIFLSGFFGAALAMAATGVVSTALFALTGTYSLDHLAQQYLPYYLLMVFPEGILTGTFVALLAVYRPEWIWTYDEDSYLNR